MNSQNQITPSGVPMKIPLHDYQIFCKNFVLSRPYCGLFLKMGLGKTSIVLESLWEMNPTGHVLIIAPKTVARCTWINEIRKWNLPFRCKSLIVNEKGKQLTKKKREEIYAAIPTDRPTVYFINRDMIAKLIDYFPGNRWPFPHVIIDESQSFKSYSAVRFKAMKTVRPFIRRLVLLTGSPMPTSMMDLWSQIWLLDMGQRLGKNITAYRNTYFLPGIISNGYPVTWRPQIGAEDTIFQKIGDIVVSMKNDFLKLPPLTYHNAMVSMEPDELKRYKAFAKDYVLELANGDIIDAGNAAVLQGKLSQMASGAIYTDSKTHEYEIIHKNKLDMCKYIIDNTPDNVIVAYHFQSDLDMMLKYFAENDMEAKLFDGSPEMENAWNNKEIPIMLLQPAANGIGVNLQRGGATLIWYTLPWSLEEYEQTNTRIYRQGQQQPCVIHHLMTEHTVDTKILSALERKDDSQNALIEAVEATLEDIRGISA